MKMDRTSMLGAIACALLFLGLSFYIEATYRPAPKPADTATTAAGDSIPASEGAEPEEAGTTAPGAETPDATPTADAGTSATGEENVPSASPAKPTKLEQAREELGDAREVTLENDLMKAVFTTHGGAIQYIDLKDHPAEGDQQVRLNTGSREPVFNLYNWNGTNLLKEFDLVSSGENEVVFSTTFPNGIQVTRRYALAENYQVILEQAVSNSLDRTIKAPTFRLNLGTEGPIHRLDVDRLIGAAWLTRDGSFHKISVLDFLAGGLFGFEWSEAKDIISSEPDEAPVQWAAANNQFYVLLMTPPADEGILRVDVLPRTLPQWKAEKYKNVAKAAQARAWMPGFSLDPDTSRTSTYTLYAGPKEYGILSNFDRNQSLIMDFGWFGWIIIPLLAAMNLIHGLLFSSLVWGWGWTIILLTVLIKALLWPLQSIANKNMKRMQQLHPKIEEIRHKYKDDPQKMNEQVFKIYKDYGVNPAGGCLPMLVQMPIFIGFYIMLQSAVELRGESFLWIADLTQPDTIYRLPTESFLGYDFPINPLPVLMTITTVVLMQMNPAASDNPQMKMFKWLPVIFLIVLYNFAAALPLYWTVNNIIQGIQTYINLRKPLPELKKVTKD